MQADKIERINALAKKAREQGLTDQEKQEQLALRQEYIAAFRQSLTHQLENTYLVDEQGNKRKLERRKNNGK